MTQGSECDSAYLRSWIGREEVTNDLLTVDLVRKFKATFGQPPEDLQPGATAPRLVHFCLGQPAALTHELSQDGHPKRGGFLPPVPLPRRMWAGGRSVFHDELRIGDRVRRVSRIADVIVKNGQSGVLCFVTVAHEIDVCGRPVVSETQNIVYREAVNGMPAKASALEATGTHRRQVEPSPLLLFRYSALTFNGHRIHYDRPYAAGVEGYPGLVVHGPLQATLLIQYATEIRGGAPARFSFRSVAPLFDDAVFHLNAEPEPEPEPEPGGLKLWTASADGSLATTATAEW